MDIQTKIFYELKAMHAEIEEKALVQKDFIKSCKKIVYMQDEKELAKKELENYNSQLKLLNKVINMVCYHVID